MSLEFLTLDKPARVDAQIRVNRYSLYLRPHYPPRPTTKMRLPLPPLCRLLRLLSTCPMPVFILTNSNALRTVLLWLACEIVRNVQHSRRGRCVDQ